MGVSVFNPVGFAINASIGWFVLSFARAAFRSLFSGNWAGLASRFKDIAFFHDGRAALLNVAIIITIAIVANGLWALTRRG